MVCRKVRCNVTKIYKQSKKLRVSFYLTGYNYRRRNFISDHLPLVDLLSIKRFAEIFWSLYQRETHCQVTEDKIDSSDYYSEAPRNSRKTGANQVHQEMICKEITALKHCPLCKEEGRNGVINLCQLTDDTALQICTYPQCAYPMGTDDELEVKRSVYDCPLSEEEHKWYDIPYTPSAPKTVSALLKLAWNNFLKKEQQLYRLVKKQRFRQD